MIEPLWLDAKDVQIFRAPGTWTWPGNVSEVEVLIVGGGGGGGSRGPLNGFGGGGGRVYYDSVPVTGPVPITIGAGGIAGTGTTSPNSGTAGGTTSFGSINIGGGGGGAGGSAPVGSAGTNAPPDGGGGGGGRSEPTTRGAFGGSGTSIGGGGAVGSALSTGIHDTGLIGGIAGDGRYGFGGGGASGGSFAINPPALFLREGNLLHRAVDGGGVPSSDPNVSDGRANTGGGGAGIRVQGLGFAGDGGSGVVYVVVR